MEISWYGQSCFRLRSRGLALVTDPYSPETGLKLPRLTANVVTVSHDHEDHNYVKGVKGSPYVITGPGEYEVGGVFVFGVATYHDARQGEERGKNTAYLIEFEGVTICHLGDLGHALTQEQVEQLNGIDVLLIPVGGRTTLTGARAAEVVGVLEPKVVIPMHYKIRGLEASLETANRFLKEMGVETPERMETLTITEGQYEEADDTRVVLLEPLNESK
ncbi:MAG: MBL fold metallo-hydrolase [Chloroflexi bacterium]|jgi:L-ascorbate metabolism protein UlaG (beta-lactamase superfamily)|nr:MBL fold metallo-hydrolase [Chloroflexota bacterium]